jgi:1-deoxy-D-xylulose-5-phosphate synthase
VNDNGRSYAPTIGGWRASSTRCAPSSRTATCTSRAGRAFDRLGRPARAFYRGVRGGLHGFLSRVTGNEALYSNLEIKYIGPVDGHDVRAMEAALRQAKDYGAP